MPTDMNGREITVGAVVLLPCVVRAVSEEADSNVTVQAQMAWDGKSYRQVYTLSGRQVVVAEGGKGATG